MGTDERIRDMHILLVDDSTYNLALFETMLMDDGYTRISTALNATSAYELLARHDDIALVVLDIIMPDIDGLEACRYIKSQAPLQDIPILIATAKTDLETLQSAFDLGASDYVRKPLVNSIELLARVRNLLNTQLELQLRRQGEEQLRKLNQELEERVQAEVEKNRQKDQVMLHQARLAEMGEMIGYIAHQWRQPLNVVGLLCQEHYDHYCNGELSRDIMESGTTKILDQLEFMSQTIDDFRDFFRPDKSKSRFSIRHAIETTLSLVGAAMEKNNIRVQVQCDATPEVEGYPKEYAQVLLNIINNARDAIIDNRVADPRIHIRVYTDHGKAVVSIHDNGGGIPDEIIEKMYYPYFSTKQEGHGTGLGLYMSKMIIERNMGGKIWARNRDGGAEFFVEMP